MSSSITKIFCNFIEKAEGKLWILCEISTVNRSLMKAIDYDISQFIAVQKFNLKSEIVLEKIE